ncbi:MAG: T9SS type A sorting domain-containing protein, partial [Bacteroidales bacterium]
CPCEKVDIKVTPTQHMEECRIIYYLDVTICNNGSNTACFDALSSLISGINILGTNNFPLTVSPGDCKTFDFKFEVTDPLASSATFRIYDKCNDCYKEFTVDINVEIVDCEKEIVIKDLKYNTDVSNENVSYFNFSLYLPSNPQAIFRVWSEPYQVIDHIYNSSSSIIDGLAMFDYGVLTQMAENGEEVCFHVLMCQDNIIHECVICIDAHELLMMIEQVAKSTPSTPIEHEKQQNQQDNLYLIPNPASNYVSVEGIKKDNISELLLLDMNGKSIIKVQSSNTLDIQNISKGTYILRVISNNNKVYYLKLVKN